MQTISDERLIAEINYDTDDNTDNNEDCKENLITIVKDRYNLTYIIFFILGIGTLIPYNFFIISNKYFNYKLRPLTNDNTSLNGTSFLQESFINVSNISANISTTIFIILNTIYGFKIKINYRFYTTGLFIFILFILTTIIVKINTDSWQYSFYLLTIITIILINANAGVYGCTIYGYASILPSIYTQAICMGQVAAGLFTAIAQIVTNLLAPDPIESGLLFFSIGCVIILINIICFGFVQRTEFVKYFENKRNLDAERVNTNTTTNRVLVIENINDLTPLLSNRENVLLVQPVSLNCEIIKHLFKKCWYYLLTLYFINIVTSSLYPGVSASVKSVHFNENRFSTEFFVPVMFLLQNVSDLVGRILCGFAPMSVQRRTLIGLLSYSRIILIPLFIFCNIQPRFRKDLIFFDDIWFYLFVTLNGFTNGYLCTLCLMHIPKLVDTSLSELLSSLAQLLLMMGIVFGSIIAFFITSLV